MNREEIILHVRDTLGDPGPYGTWSDDELVRYLTLESNRHAQEGLSAPTEVFTNSIRGVDEYRLPNDYAEMIRVSYIRDELQHKHQKLHFITKDRMDNYRSDVSIGPPRYYTLFNERIILYPAPSYAPLLAKNFETESGIGIETSGDITKYGQGFTFENIRDFSIEDMSVPREYNFDIELEESDEGPTLVPAIASIAHIGFFMRRQGNSDGLFRLSFTRHAERDDEGDYPSYLSAWKDINGLSTLGTWVYFDFTNNPISIETFADDISNVLRFTLRFSSDDQYIAETESETGGAQIAIDDDNSPFFEFHALRNDIAIEYYKNTVEPLHDDYDVPEIPERYHRTLVDMVIAKALEKDGFNVPLATHYQGKAISAIRQARLQAKQSTLDDKIYTEPPGYIDVKEGRIFGRIF